MLVTTDLRNQKNKVIAYIGILISKKKQQWIYADIFDSIDEALAFLMIKENELKIKIA